MQYFKLSLLKRWETYSKRFIRIVRQKFWRKKKAKQKIPVSIVAHFLSLFFESSNLWRDTFGLGANSTKPIDSLPANNCKIQAAVLQHSTHLRPWNPASPSLPLLLPPPTFRELLQNALSLHHIVSFPRRGKITFQFLGRNYIAPHMRNYVSL